MLIMSALWVLFAEDVARGENVLHRGREALRGSAHCAFKTDREVGERDALARPRLLKTTPIYPQTESSHNHEHQPLPPPCLPPNIAESNNQDLSGR